MPFPNQIVWLRGASSGTREAFVAPLVQGGARVTMTARDETLIRVNCRSTFSRPAPTGGR